MPDDELPTHLRSAEVSFSAWGRDLVVGWSAPWGPTLGRIVRGRAGDRSASTVRPFVLGEPSTLRVTPQLVALGERLACVWVDLHGGALSLLETHGAPPAGAVNGEDAEHEGGAEHALALGNRTSLGEDARAIAVAAAERGHAWVAIAREDGVHVGTLDVRGGVRLDAAPWIRRATSTPRLQLAEVRGEPVLCAIYPGERELWIARREGERVAVVTHRLDDAVSELALAVAGSRVAIALRDAGGSRVYAAHADARGKLTERPLLQLDGYVGDQPVGALDGVNIVWVDDAFHLIVRDASSRTVYALPFFEPGVEARPVPRVVGPPAARFVAQRLELASIEHDDDEGRLTLTRTRIDGTETDTLQLRLAPPRARARERAVGRARLCCTELARALAGATYRDATLVPRTTERGATLSLDATHQILELRYLGDREVQVSLRTEGPSAPSLLGREAPLARAARWLEQKLSARAAALAAAETAWAQEMALVLGGETVVRSALTASAAHAALLEVVLTEVPQAHTLAAWIERVRMAVQDGAHKRPVM